MSELSNLKCIFCKSPDVGKVKPISKTSAISSYKCQGCGRLGFATYYGHDFEKDGKDAGW